MLALPDSCVFLGIDTEFRTIDIDTSDQVHHIGGRFDEALSTSLSIHGAHEEALRRIEHYSLTSMHSSAHSIRSMDSIRTELSRLEAMITTASVTHPSETEIRDNHAIAGSSRTERRISGLLPGHGWESSTAKDSGINLAPQHGSSNGIQQSVDRSNQPQRTEDMAAEHFSQPDPRQSTNYRPFLDKSKDVNNSCTDNPSEGGNRSSFLYAEFSKTSQPRQHGTPRIELDCDAIHPLLRQSLESIYPPEVVRYVSLRQTTTLCEVHINLIDKKPIVEMSGVGKMKEISYVEHSTPSSARPSMINLRDQLIELKKAIKLSRAQCIGSGYSLSELDKLLSPPGSRSSAPADRPSRTPELYSGDDSSSIYSEDYHSVME